MIPTWWEFALLGLAAYRTFRLLAWDVVADRPRGWVLDRIGGPGSTRGSYWGDFVTCPYCAGFWISLLWVGAFWLWPHATTVAAVPWALSALVAILATNLDPETRD